MKLLIRCMVICAAALMALSHHVAFANQAPILADFDDGLPRAFVSFNDVQDSVTINLIAPAPEIATRPGQSTQNRVMKVDFDVQGFGGVVQPYFDTANDWTGYAGVGFWFYGEGSGRQYQFEIYENRADLALDPKSGERFEVRFDDTTAGWRKLTFSFDDFRRSTDFQEPGALDDGFTLDAVSGYSIVLPIEAAGTVYIDDIQLLPNDPLANFETGLGFNMFVFPGSDPINVVTQTINTVAADDTLALPSQAGLNRILEVPYNVEQFGGFTHTFDSAPRDWSDFAGISFWFYGEGTANRYQFEIFDNRSNENEDTAERYEYQIADDFVGWRFFQIAFSDFVRAADYQPPGAPEDGLGLEQVWGYSVTLPLGEGTLRLDDIMLYNFVALPSSRLLASYDDAALADFFPFSGEASSVITDLVTIQPTDAFSLPNQIDAEQVFGVTYNNSDFAGFSQFLPAAPESWSGYTGLRFWFYGTGANVSYEFEILTNRSDPSFDTSERFEVRIFDAEPGWKQIELPFTQFERAGFQPEGAPEDGFNLSEVWGYAITLPQGAGTFYIDEIELVRTVDIANYDTVSSGSIFSFSGISSTITNTLVAVDSVDLFALAGETEKNTVLEIQYSIRDFGGVTTSYAPFPKDWSGAIGLSFRMFGTNTQGRFQFEIWDQRGDRNTESSEIFEYVLTDDFTGWKEFRLLFSEFERARDFQYEGAPQDGFTTSEIWAYSITLPEGDGAIYLDNIALVRQAAGLPPVLYMPMMAQ